MRRIYAERLDPRPEYLRYASGLYTIGLVINDEGVVQRDWGGDVVDTEDLGDRVRLLFKSERLRAEDIATIRKEDWERLHTDPDWQRVEGGRYQRQTPLGLAEMVSIPDLMAGRPGDYILLDMYRARVVRGDGRLLTNYMVFCGTTRAEAWSLAAQWVVALERGERSPVEVSTHTRAPAPDLSVQFRWSIFDHGFPKRGKVLGQVETPKSAQLQEPYWEIEPLETHGFKTPGLKPHTAKVPVSSIRAPYWRLFPGPDGFGEWSTDDRGEIYQFMRTREEGIGHSTVLVDQVTSDELGLWNEIPCHNVAGR